MSEKKNNIFKNLFRSSGGCGCGISIVEEELENSIEKEKEE